ncbi:unnamed protein product [Moneuplotes crassus]|uniref:Uncharacterized protein n=1 Tax=Euplotes crassus TaxID=5936 RepID=A0AAD1XZS7_EUPCR|nr:unnamed protein product [Moneuplotes crassus]
MFYKWRTHNEGKRMGTNNSGLGSTGIFMITQGNQGPDNDKIISLRPLGYYKGDKRDLNESLKKLQALNNNSLQNTNDSAIPTHLRKRDDYSDCELSLESDNEEEFEAEAIQYLEGLLRLEVPPVLIYIPTEKVMRQLILMNL